MSPARRASDSVSDSHKKRLHKRKARAQRYKPNNLLRRFLILVVIAIFSGLLWQIFSSWQGRVWKEGSRFTVVVAEEDPVVYSYSKRTGVLTILKIPKSAQIEAAGGFGSWFIGSLWGLGEQEGLKGELLATSVKKSLGIPVDAWVDARGRALFEADNLSFLLSVKDAILFSTLSTNLTFFDRVRLLLGPGSTGQSLRRGLDPVALRVLEKVELPDGVEGYMPVAEQAQVVFEKTFRDDAVFEEGKTLTVVNSTEKAGLAREVARLASVLGARVIGTQTGEPEEDCVLKGEKENLDSLTGKRLARLLDCETKEAATSGAHLELFLGEGFARTF